MKKFWLSAAMSLFFSGFAYSAPEQSYVNMVSMLLNQDYETFMNAGSSLMGAGVTDPMTASDLIAMYEKNELSANRKLKDKLVRIRSVASEIGENATGQAYVRIDGKDQLQNILLYVDGKDEKILNLEKGMKVDFVCHMDKYIMHTPILKQCVFSSDFAKGKKDFFKKSISDEKVTTESQVFFVAMYDVNKDVLKPACIKPDDKCMKTLTDTFKSKERIEKTKERAIKVGEENNIPPLHIK